MFMGDKVKKTIKCSYCGNNEEVEVYEIFGNIEMMCDSCEATDIAEKARISKEFKAKKRDEFIDRFTDFAPVSVNENIKVDENKCDYYKTVSKALINPKVWSIVVRGEPDAGKTHLIAKTIRHLAIFKADNKKESPIDFLFKSNKHGVFLAATATELIFSIQSRYEHGDSEDVIKKICGVNILVIDDLGIEKKKEDSKYLMEDILFKRHSEGLKTIITTNEGDISERYSGRTERRLNEGVNIVIKKNR